MNPPKLNNVIADMIAYELLFRLRFAVSSGSNIDNLNNTNTRDE